MFGFAAGLPSTCSSDARSGSSALAFGSRLPVGFLQGGLAPPRLVDRADRWARSAASSAASLFVGSGRWSARTSCFALAVGADRPAGRGVRRLVAPIMFPIVAVVDSGARPATVARRASAASGLGAARMGARRAISSGRSRVTVIERQSRPDSASSVSSSSRFFSALFARLWYLQVAATSNYAAAATSNRCRGRERAAHPRPDPRRQGHVRSSTTASTTSSPSTATSRCREPDDGREAGWLDAARRPRREAAKQARRSPGLAVHPGPGRRRTSPSTVLAYVSRAQEELPGRAAPRRSPVRSYPNGRLPRNLLGYVGEINADELKAQHEGRGLRARRHDRQERGRAHLRVGPARAEPAYDRVEVDSHRPGHRARSVDHEAEARPRRPAHDRPRHPEAGRGVARRRGSSRPRRDQGHEHKQRFKTLAAPARIRRRARRARRARSWRWRRTRRTTPTTFVNGIPTSTWQRSRTTRAATTRWSTGRSHGQYAPGIDVQARDCDRRTAESGDITADAVRSTTRKVLRIRRTRSGSSTATTTPRTAASTCRARSRCRATCTSTPSAATCTTAGSTVSRAADALQDDRRASSGSASRPGSRYPTRPSGACPDAGVEEEGPRRRTRSAFPYAGLAAGRQHPHRGRSGRPARDAAPARQRLRDVRQRRHAVRAAARRRGARRRAARRSASCRRSRPASRGLPATATRCWPGSPASSRTARAAPRTTSFQGFPAGWSRARPVPPQVQGKQATSLFVGMTPAGNPKYVVLAVVEEGGYGARDRGPDRPRGSCEGSTACRSPTSSTPPPTRATDVVARRSHPADHRSDRRGWPRRRRCGTSTSLLVGAPLVDRRARAADDLLVDAHASSSRPASTRSTS